MNQMQSNLDERSHKLLKTLIEYYIRDGQPIGSRTLSRDAAINLSSASVRNVMSDLEEMGLIQSPHTSAGRVPTVKGYRLFIDTMMKTHTLEEKELQGLRHQLDPDLGVHNLIKSTSSILSEFTQFAGVVMLPKGSKETNALRQIEFLPLSDKRVLVILVLNEKEVQNRIIHTDRDYTQSELQQAANYLNLNYAGKDLSSIGKLLEQELIDVQAEFNDLMKLVVSVANMLPGEQMDDELIVDGQANLVASEDLSDLEKLKQLFQAFSKKRDLLHLLGRCQHADGVQIYIGQESGYQALDNYSVVTAPYSVDGEIVGVLGVVGPTRMPYERVIPIVDITSKLLEAAITGH